MERKIGEIVDHFFCRDSLDRPHTRTFVILVCAKHSQCAATRVGETNLVRQSSSLSKTSVLGRCRICLLGRARKCIAFAVTPRQGGNGTNSPVSSTVVYVLLSLGSIIQYSHTGRFDRYPILCTSKYPRSVARCIKGV